MVEGSPLHQRAVEECLPWPFKLGAKEGRLMLTLYTTINAGA
jgi:hypothetical protein